MALYSIKIKIPTLFSSRLSATILFLYCILSGSLFAQETNIKFTHLNHQDGLSHNKVNCIYQDHVGFIWISTLEGLNKYDGRKFTIYKWDKNDSTTISANLIRDIHEDSKGRLWIGTEAGGLNLYNRKNDSFIQFTADSTSPIRLQNNDVNSIAEDHDGKLWLGTESGITLFDYENNKATNWLIYPDSKNQPLRNFVYVVYIDNENALWIGTDEGGVTSFDKGSEEFTYYLSNPNDPQSLSDNDIRSIYEDNAGNLWFGAYEGGLNLLNKTTNQFTHFRPGSRNTESATVRAIIDDNDGRLWVGTRNGLYNFDPQKNNFTHFNSDPHNVYSLCQNNVQTFLKDAKGDLWIGTRGGISCLNLNTTAFIHYRTDATNKRGFNNSLINAILEDRNGDLWFGTEEGGLNLLDLKTGMFTYYVHDPSDPASISNNNIKSLLEDNDGNIWASSFHGGLNVLNRKTGRFRHYYHNPADSKSINFDDIRALYQDRDGDIWLGTIAKGIGRYNKTTDTFIHIPISESLNGARDIYIIMQDHQGFIWAGAGESLALRIDKHSGSIKYFHIPTLQGGIEVNAIFEDVNNNLWFGTVGGGLFFYNRTDETFRVFNKKSGLPSNIILSILSDDDKNLWLSSSSGLSKLNPETGEVKTFYRENGLQSDQFTGASLKHKNGLLFIGSINGVTAFNPKNIQSNTYIPPVVITDFRIFNKSIPVGGKHPILKEHISMSKEITLSYKQTIFSFEFAALNYASSELNQYAYKMEGFETEWNYVGNRNFATYTNLNPGNYIFRVKAANNDGLWNEEGTSIRIQITSSFWQSIWFKLILIILFLIVLRHLYNYQKQKRNLFEAKSLAHLAQLMLLRNQMNPHFLFNTLGSIRSMINVNKNQAWQMISELAAFYRYTLQYYDKIEIPLSEEIEAARNYLAIEKIRFRDISEFEFRVDDSALKCIVPAFIIQPLLENAIMHGKKTGPKHFKVIADIRYEKNVLSIDISNTGTLVIATKHASSESGDHGYSLDNIQQRLTLMFEDQFTLNLFEEDGWVHAKIRIQSPREQLNGQA